MYINYVDSLDARDTFVFVIILLKINDISYMKKKKNSIVIK